MNPKVFFPRREWDAESEEWDAFARRILKGARSRWWVECESEEWGAFAPENSSRSVSGAPRLDPARGAWVTIMTYANHLLHLHMKITKDYVKDLLAEPHDISRWLDQVIDNGELNAVLGLSLWRALEGQFLPAERVRERYRASVHRHYSMRSE